MLLEIFLFFVLLINENDKNKLDKIYKLKLKVTWQHISQKSAGIIEYFKLKSPSNRHID